MKRIIHQAIARLANYWPYLSRRLTAAYTPVELGGSPWTPVTRPLNQSRIALVTTAGIHHRDQPPFDMADSDGDPSYRILDAAPIETDYTITHDYYDHRDADQDLNVVFPIARLKEMATAGCIGALAPRHFSFMGHIDGPHIDTLKTRSAPEVAAMLKEDGVDIALLTPA
jgi:D-proline reductase (dithiol) PrdB